MNSEIQTNPWNPIRARREVASTACKGMGLGVRAQQLVVNLGLGIKLREVEVWVLGCRDGRSDGGRRGAEPSRKVTVGWHASVDRFLLHSTEKTVGQCNLSQASYLSSDIEVILRILYSVLHDDMIPPPNTFHVLTQALLSP
jgi:hypothetical protein